MSQSGEESIKDDKKFKDNCNKIHERSRSRY